MALTDSASMRAWAGSYTPQGRSQCAVASTAENMRAKRMDPSGCRDFGSSGTLLAVIVEDMPERPGAETVPSLATAWVLARITGPSMSPTVRHGDRLLVRRLDAGTPVRPGSVVLARFPARPELLVVKRVRRAVPGGAWVLGDNPRVTDDSRAFGPAVPVGRVLARLWPRPGRLGAAPPAVSDLGA